MVKNTFSYKRDSAGIGCGFCIYCHMPDVWPDTEKVLRCEKHGISLSFMLDVNGYMYGGFICAYYIDNGEGLASSREHFTNTIVGQLSTDILYSMEEYEEYLLETPFNELK